MASSKTVELLLLENVDTLGIVGDVVTVRTGYARNYLLPRGLATTPSQELIAQLADRRAKAEAERAALRAEREKMIGKLNEFRLTVTKACNDQGLLYGSVTQQDIADLLEAQGFDVAPRDVRIGQTIKRVGEFEITVKPERDLEATVVLVVESDTPLEIYEDEEESEEGQGEAAVEGAEAETTDEATEAASA
ncbi:MAG: 50S ribosomal protein L9 [Phycisphaerales bacterium JB065]